MPDNIYHGQSKEEVMKSEEWQKTKRTSLITINKRALTYIGHQVIKED